MTTLYDSTTRIKSRKSRRVFGQGVPVSDRRQPYSAQDLTWWSAQTAGEPDWDQLAGQSAALTAMEAGCAPF